MTTSSLSRLALCVLPVTLIGCPRDKNEEPITAAEALQAVEESTLESQAQGLTTDTIEIATHFTIGQEAEVAAQELSKPPGVGAAVLGHDGQFATHGAHPGAV